MHALFRGQCRVCRGARSGSALTQADGFYTLRLGARHRWCSVVLRLQTQLSPLLDIEDTFAGFHPEFVTRQSGELDLNPFRLRGHLGRGLNLRRGKPSRKFTIQYKLLKDKRKGFPLPCLDNALIPRVTSHRLLRGCPCLSWRCFTKQTGMAFGLMFGRDTKPHWAVAHIWKR